MRNFKQLKIWQKGFSIAIKSINLSQTFPDKEKFGLSSQITKSAVSIPSNIPEGRSRTSDKDYSRFIEISLGSSFELETQLLIAEAVSYGIKELTTALLNELDEEQKMLMSFQSRLKT